MLTTDGRQTPDAGRRTTDNDGQIGIGSAPLTVVFDDSGAKKVNENCENNNKKIIKNQKLKFKKSGPTVLYTFITGTYGQNFRRIH